MRDYGGEAIRLWSAIEGDLSKNDLKCSEERISAELKTLNKLLNISKFVMLFEKPKSNPVLNPLDELFIDYVEEMSIKIGEKYDRYDFFHPAVELRKFLWDTFASHYIEIVKPRAYNFENKFTDAESNSAKYAIHFLLERILLLLYPIIPQITSFIAEEKKFNLLDTAWPETKKRKNTSKIIDEIINFDSEIWKRKKEKGKSLKAEISGVNIPKTLKKFEKDLITAHNIIK